MEISFDPARREWTLLERGLDFLDARKVFEETTIDQEDDRFDYGETRVVTVGWLSGRMVVGSHGCRVAWLSGRMVVGSHGCRSVDCPRWRSACDFNEKGQQT